jgi:hypothetical protein
MDKKMLLIYVLLTGIGILLVSRYIALAGTLLLIFVGSIYFLFLTYRVFKFEQAFYFQLLSRIFTAITLIVGIFLAKPYFKFTIIALPITLSLAIIFGGLAAYKMNKQRTKKK